MTKSYLIFNRQTISENFLRHKIPCFTLELFQYFTCYFNKLLQILNFLNVCFILNIQTFLKYEALIKILEDE